MKKKYLKCHEGNVLVFKKGNIVFYGGGLNRGASLENVDFLIDVGSGLWDETKIVKSSKENLEMKIDYVKVDWKDYEAPRYLKKEWWLKLIEVLEQLAQGKEEYKVLVSCLGGHGRTGTALAILYGLITGSKTPVKDIRKLYCEKAVESKAQVKYLEKILKIKVEEDLTDFEYDFEYKPSFKFGFTGYKKYYEDI